MKQLNASNLHLSFLNYNCKDICTFKEIFGNYGQFLVISLCGQETTLDSGDSSGPFHVNLHVNKSYSAMACVKYPFALLHGNWTWNDTVRSMSCDYCNLTQCVNQSWWKEFERWACNSNFLLVIVKARTEVWLPINLTRPWSDSFAVSHLVTAVQTLLHRSRRMLGVVIASILAIASVTATAAMANLALHQGFQIADFVRDWYKDSHLLWQ